MGNGKVLFAVIGNPREYGNARYVYVDEEGRGRSVDDNVSFRALAKILGINDTVVIAGFSLLSDTNCDGYRDCASKVVDYVRDALKLDGDVKVLVAPNIYGEAFRQNPPGLSLYLNFIYYNALKIMERLGVNEVYLDITHGINYMPTLAKDAIELALNAYAHSVNHDINFAVFNSDPYIKGAGDNQVLFINKVREGGVNTVVSMNNILAFFSNINNMNRMQRTTLISIKYGCTAERDFVRNTFKLARALASGLFLYIKAREKYIRDCLDALDSYMRDTFLWDPESNTWPNIRIKPGNKGFIYETMARQEIALIHALYYALNKVLDVLNNCKCKVNYALNIECLRAAAEKFHLNDAVKEMVNNEIRKLKQNKQLHERAKDRWELLRNITRREDYETKQPCELTKDDERNLYAHAGLLDNITFVTFTENNICLSYRDPNGKDCAKNIEELL